MLFGYQNYQKKYVPEEKINKQVLNNILGWTIPLNSSLFITEL